MSGSEDELFVPQAASQPMGMAPAPCAAAAVIPCNVCEQPLLPGQPRYRGVNTQHAQCGADEVLPDGSRPPPGGRMDTLESQCWDDFGNTSIHSACPAMLPELQSSAVGPVSATWFQTIFRASVGASPKQHDCKCRDSAGLCATCRIQVKSEFDQLPVAERAACVQPLLETAWRSFFRSTAPQPRSEGQSDQRLAYAFVQDLETHSQPSRSSDGGPPETIAAVPRRSEAHSHVSGTRRTDQLEKALGLVHEKFRVRELRSRQAVSLFDRLSFIAHQRYVRGRSKQAAVRLWDAAKLTSRCVKVKGKEMVWTKLPQQVLNDDVIGERVNDSKSMGKQLGRNLLKHGLTPTGAAASALDLPDGLVLLSDDDASDADDGDDAATAPQTTKAVECGSDEDDSDNDDDDEDADEDSLKGPRAKRPRAEPKNKDRRSNPDQEGETTPHSTFRPRRSHRQVANPCFC